jgi:hypothetical protein
MSQKLTRSMLNQMVLIPNGALSVTATNALILIGRLTDRGTTMDEGHIDEETGEILSLSAKAIEAAGRRDRGQAAQHLGIGRMAYYEAMQRAMGDLPIWIKTDRAGAHKIKYASLKAILETVKPILLRHGIIIRQGVERTWPMDDGQGVKGRLVPVYTDLIHVASGDVDRTQIEIPLIKMDAPAMGSAITYGRRYTLLTALSLATDEADDDGDAAMLRSLSDEHRDSSDLAKLSYEMVKIKEPSKLALWAEEDSQKKQFARLTGEELQIMRGRYREYGQKLLATPEEPVKAKRETK